MATTIQQVTGFLDEFDLSYDASDEHQAIAIGFKLDEDSTSYRDTDGDAHLQLVIRVVEDGEFVAVMAPSAWNVADCRHRAAVFEALLTIQGRYKMLRFDFDSETADIQPNIELALEDAPLTSKLFHRLMHGVIHGVQRFDRVIRHAMETGDVRFDLLEERPTTAEDASDMELLEGLAEQVGGIDALERLLGGDGLQDGDDDCGQARRAG